MKNYGLLERLEKTKHKSILYQNFCRSSYMPKKNSVSHVRKVFEKYVTGKEEFVKSIEKDWTLIENKVGIEEGKGFGEFIMENQKDFGFKNAFVVRIKSPSLKIRKGTSRGLSTGTNSSLLIRRAKIYMSSSPKIRGVKSRVVHRNENSNYMSYSDIYQSFLKNLSIK